MGATEKIIIILCTVATVRTHSHGIRLIIILALAYLLQQGQKKGNKKPSSKSLFRRSTDSLLLSSDEDPLLHAASILQRALDLDQLECTQRAVCRLGMREASGRLWDENDRLLLRSIFGNKYPKSKGEEAFQIAADYGRRSEGDRMVCRQRYNKCPHSDNFVDSILAGIS